MTEKLGEKKETHLKGHRLSEVDFRVKKDNSSNKPKKDDISDLFSIFFEQELDEYCDSFMASLQYTKCHICNNKLCSCLPIHIPLITSHIFICAECLFLLAEQLDVLGSMQEFIDKEIKAGKIREEGGNKNNVTLVFTKE